MPTEINKTGSHRSSSSSSSTQGSSQGSSRSSKVALPSAKTVGNRAITRINAPTLSSTIGLHRLSLCRRRSQAVARSFTSQMQHAVEVMSTSSTREVEQEIS